MLTSGAIKKLSKHEIPVAPAGRKEVRVDIDTWRAQSLKSHVLGKVQPKF